MSLQLRYLQTVLEMSSERTSTIILPLPIDLLAPVLGRVDGGNGGGQSDGRREAPMTTTGSR
jgi:hypothetical protein